MRLRLFWDVYEAYAEDPIDSKRSQGRFHMLSSPGRTSFLAERASTAWREVVFRWRANEGAYRMVEIESNLIISLISLTQALGNSMVSLASNSWRTITLYVKRLRTSFDVREFRRYEPIRELAGRPNHCSVS